MSRLNTIAELCSNTDVKFGTSGVRGPVSELTKTLCQGFTNAFLSGLCQDHNTIAIGRDLRPSSPAIEQWITEQALTMGLNVLQCGTLPTPALAYYAMQNNIPCIMVTGSHIPFDRNGIKFYLPSGEISKTDEHCISTTLLSYNVKPKPLGVKLACEKEAIEFYIKRYLYGFSTLNLTGKRIGVYQHSSVARDVMTNLLKAFGADVIALGRSQEFVPLDTEAVAETDQKKAYRWSVDYQLDAIVSADGDGDRPLIADEAGQWMRGDQVGILTCSALNGTHIATPINTNTGLEQYLPYATTQRTKIGSPYVIEAMKAAKKTAICIGFEANGGVLMGSDTQQLAALPTRDAILPILSILELSNRSRISLSKLVNTLPTRFTASDKLQNITPKSSRDFIQAMSEDTNQRQKIINRLWSKECIYEVGYDTLDGLRIYLSNQAIFHLRMSGNAPELRVYTEEASPQAAHVLCQRLINLLERALPK